MSVSAKLQVNRGHTGARVTGIDVGTVGPIDGALTGTRDGKLKLKGILVGLPTGAWEGPDEGNKVGTVGSIEGAHWGVRDGEPNRDITKPCLNTSRITTTRTLKNISSKIRYILKNYDF